MGQLGHGLRFALQPHGRLVLVAELGVKDLDSDLALEVIVVAEINDTHPATAEFSQNHKPTDLGGQGWFVNRGRERCDQTNGPTTRSCRVAMFCLLE